MLRFLRHLRGDQGQSEVVGQTGKKGTMSNTDKKKWSTPRLRVFVKTRTEESVLTVCKMYGSGNNGSGTYHSHCGYSSPCTLICSSSNGS